MYRHSKTSISDLQIRICVVTAERCTFMQTENSAENSN